MGWRELCAWHEAMSRQRQRGTSAEPDPERWTEASRRNYAMLDAMRQKARGRMH